MKTKIICRKCGTEMEPSGVFGYPHRCPKCNKNYRSWECDLRKFPEKKRNKVYAVDVYASINGVIEMEAKSKKEAEKKVRAFIDELCANSTSREVVEELVRLGFEDGEDFEFHTSGEANKDGEMSFY